MSSCAAAWQDDKPVTPISSTAAQGTRNVAENITGVKADADAAAAAADDVKQASDTLEKQGHMLGGQVQAVGGQEQHFRPPLAVERRAENPLHRLRAFLERAGYETRAQSEAFSTHVHGDLALGRLDVLYVDDETARQVFAAKRAARFVTRSSVAVPSPDHLIAMKAQSLRADPERRGDVEDLLTLLARDDVDREAAEQHFRANGLDEIYRSLLERMRRP